MRLMLSCLLAVSAAVFAPLDLPAADQPTPGPFTLGVMRRDGVMIPFAQYDGRNWRNDWPTPFSEVDVPISLPNVPKRWWGKVPAASEWVFWETGGTPRPVKIAAPLLYDAHCVSNIGLKTDYRATQPVPPPIIHHHPKDGLVVTGGVRIEPIEVLRDHMPEWKEALNWLGPHVDAIEKRSETSWTWPGAGSSFNSRRRAEIPFVLEVLCRTPGLTPGSYVYYFEALRRYPIPPQRSSMAREFTAFSRGYVLPGRPPDRTVDSAELEGSILMQPDFDYMYPLGAIRVGAKLFWVAQWSGRGRERYTVTQMDAKKVKTVVNTAGGGC